MTDIQITLATDPAAGVLLRAERHDGRPILAVWKTGLRVDLAYDLTPDEMRALVERLAAMVVRYTRP